MKAIALVLMLLSLLAMPFAAVSAQSPQDNACYPGGSMAGKCDTEWEWVCGWYLARWEQAGGWSNSTNRLNDACSSLLPPLPNRDLPGGNVTFCKVWAMTIYFCANPGFATGDFVPADGIVDAYYIFSTSVFNTPAEASASCPSTFMGLPLDPFESVGFAPLYLFSADELALLNFPAGTASMCVYF